MLISLLENLIIILKDFQFQKGNIQIWGIFGKNNEFKGRSVYFETEEEMEKFAKNTEEKIAEKDVYHRDYKGIQRYKLTK